MNNYTELLLPGIRLISSAVALGFAVWLLLLLAKGYRLSVRREEVHHWSSAVVAIAALLLLAFTIFPEIGLKLTKEGVEVSLKELQKRQVQLATNQEEIEKNQIRLEGSTAEIKKETHEAKAAAGEALQIVAQVEQAVSDVQKVAITSVRRQVRKFSVPFESDNSKITLSEAEKALSDAISFLRSKPYELVIVTGHADNEGSDLDNLNLSLKRAAVAAKEIRARANVPVEKLLILGIGEALPLEIVSDEQAHEMNRRVDITVKSAFNP